jgi:hypothetical protein
MLTPPALIHAARRAALIIGDSSLPLLLRHVALKMINPNLCAVGTLNYIHELQFLGTVAVKDRP